MMLPVLRFFKDTFKKKGRGEARGAAEYGTQIPTWVGFLIVVVWSAMLVWLGNCLKQ